MKVIGITGGIGSGKSTLLNLLGGMDSASGGKRRYQNCIYG